MKIRRSTGELISRTEAAEMIGGGLVVFSTKWYQVISSPDFPPVSHMVDGDRGYYKRREIQRWIDNR